MKAKRWLRQAQNPVTIDDILADYADGSTNTSVEVPGSAGTGGVAPPIRRCWDVTSYDYDWGNDMLCRNLDGTKFSTNYAKARAFAFRNGKERVTDEMICSVTPDAAGCP